MTAASCTLPRLDLEFILEALESADAELAALELTKDWFSSDSRDRLASAKAILCEELGVQEDREYDEETEQVLIELCFHD